MSALPAAQHSSTLEPCLHVKENWRTDACFPLNRQLHITTALTATVSGVEQ